MHLTSEDFPAYNNKSKHGHFQHAKKSKALIVSGPECDRKDRSGGVMYSIQWFRKMYFIEFIDQQLGCNTYISSTLIK